jgi:hypothetical protein
MFVSDARAAQSVREIWSAQKKTRYLLAGAVFILA